MAHKARPVIPWPLHWRRRTAKDKKAFIGFVLAGSVFLSIAMSLYDHDPPVLTVLLSIASTILIGAGLWSMLPNLLGRRRHVGAARQVIWDGGIARSVCLPVSRTLVIIHSTLSLVMILIAALTFAWFPVLMVEVGRGGYMLVTLISTSVLAVAGFGYLVGPLLRGFRRRAVVLSPAGLTYCAWFASAYFAWEWIDSVGSGRKETLEVELNVGEPSAWRPGPDDSRLGAIGWVRHYLGVIRVSLLAVNPAVAYYAIEFYRRHPELRHELGTEVGLERIRSVDFPELLEEVREHGDILRP